MFRIENTTNQEIVLMKRLFREAGQSDCYYDIPTLETAAWANDDLVLEKLFSGDFVLTYPGKTYSTVNEAVNNFKNIGPTNVNSTSYPFADKILPNGQKLFKRVHGVQATVPANTTQSISFTVPYLQAKINGLQVMGASLGDTANFKVYDNALGTISGVPDLMLNQFGFNVCLTKDFHVEESQYDADVIQGMKLELEFTNSTASSVTIGTNFIIHEVV
jgi:hypothetical protein